MLPTLSIRLLSKYRAINFEELRASLEARNELRRQSQLPLLDIEKELERHREEEREAAYWTFFDAQVEPHTRHLESVKPKGWSEAQGLQGRNIRIEEKAEIDRLWAENLRDETWREWIEEYSSA
jgi:hypothetical protein